MSETVAFGRSLASAVAPGDVVALSGPLGAGKTQLIRGLAAGCGADERLVASPTFVLCTEYPAEPTLIHVDAYRMKGLSDLESIGWGAELFAEAITAVEWADRIVSHLPDDHLRIEIDLGRDETTRLLTIQPRGRFVERWSRLREVVTPSAESSRLCPTCGTPVAADGQHRPFCSERCKLIDLGKWFDGEYALSRDVQADDEPEA